MATQLSKVTKDNYSKNVTDTTPILASVYNTAIDQINTNTTTIAALVTDVGADPTPVVRTNNPIVGTNPANTNIDALDAAIGFDAQLSGTPKDILNTLSVYQNLDRLDTYKSVRTVKKTIGGVDVEGCDFNFVTAEDKAEQVIDLGAIIPARARVIDLYLITEDTFTGATTLVAEVGNASSGAQFIASNTIYAANAVLAQATGAAFTVAPAVSASNVYVSATPGANWSNVTAGKVTVYVTFIDVTNI